MTAAPENASLADVGSLVDGIDPRFALQILPPHMDRKNRPLWLAARRRGLGSSDASALVRLNKWESQYELWADKTGRTPIEDDQSEQAEMGVLLEPVVRERFARVMDLQVRPVGLLQSQVWPWMLASPDGLCSDGNGYEGKTCSQWAAGDWSDGQTADHAELQAQWCMAVTGLSGWWVAVLIGGQRNEYRFVARNDDFIAWLADYSGEFWRKHVQADAPPAVDGSEAATVFLRDRYPESVEDSIVDVDEDERDELVAERHRLSGAEKAATAEYDAFKNRVRELLGDRERLMCGQEEIVVWRNSGQFSERRFRADHPQLAARYEVTKTVTALDAKRLCAEHPDLYRRYRARPLVFKD